MAELKLKKVFFQKDNFDVIKELIISMNTGIIVKDEFNNIIFDSNIYNITTEEETKVNEYNLLLEDSLIGFVVGEKKADVIASTISLLVKKEYEKKKLAMETLDNYREINLLYKISERIASSNDLHEIIRFVIDEAMKNIKANTGSIMLVNEQTEKLEIISEFYKDPKINLNIPRENPIISTDNDALKKVTMLGKAEIFNNIQVNPEIKNINKDIGSMLCAPLISKNKVIGIITITNDSTVTYNSKDLKLFNSFAFQATTAIENAKLYRSLQEAFFEMIEALLETLELRDVKTAGHYKRVAKYSVLIGTIIGLPKNEVSRLKIASLLHDIGKIGISDLILRSKDNLALAYSEGIKEHSIYGAEILKRIKQFKDIVPIVRSHHERYDGLGYPDKLKGTEIPILSRVIFMADEIDNIVNYEKVSGVKDMEYIVKVLNKDSGSKYDPKIVQAITKAYNEKKLDLLKVQEQLK